MKTITVNLLQRLIHKMAFVLPGGYTVRPLLHRLRGVKVGENVWISQFVYIDELHPDEVSIGDNSSIGLRTSIFTHFYWGPKRSGQHVGKVVIEKDVFIGPHCVLLPNIHIERGAVIHAGSVISRNVPAGIFIGPPKPEPIARATIPLTSERNYGSFIAGLRPIKKA